MLNSKNFWKIMMGGAVFGWAFIVLGIFFLPFCESSWIKVAWFVILLLWGVGHPLELVASLPVGKKAGLSFKRTVIKTLVFGFTWWVAVKRGVFRD